MNDLMSVDKVEDDEILYRRVLFQKNHYRIDSEFNVKISSQAFLDRQYKVSVDRAKICNFDPTKTQQKKENAVVSLLTKDVRRIDTVIERNQKGKCVEKHRIDVIPDALEDNEAHALIVTDPDYQKPKKVFRKLVDALARLANEREWVIYPLEIRDNS